jgi:hypothetical protein
LLVFVGQHLAEGKILSAKGAKQTGTRGVNSGVSREEKKYHFLRKTGGNGKCDIGTYIPVHIGLCISHRQRLILNSKEQNFRRILIKLMKAVKIPPKL